MSDVHMPLAGAYLCGDCSTISDSAVRCPSCACEHGMVSLANILDRKPLEPGERVGKLIELLDEQFRETVDGPLTGVEARRFDQTRQHNQKPCSVCSDGEDGRRWCAEQRATQEARS